MAIVDDDVPAASVRVDHFDAAGVAHAGLSSEEVGAGAQVLALKEQSRAVGKPGGCAEPLARVGPHDQAEGRPVGRAEVETEQVAAELGLRLTLTLSLSLGLGLGLGLGQSLRLGLGRNLARYRLGHSQ